MQGKKKASRMPDAGYYPPQSPLAKGGSKGGSSCIVYLVSCIAVFSLFATAVYAEELNLQQLIDEALKNNHDLISSELKVNTSKYKIPQAGSLPDPMVMFGYQNEGWNRYTFGEEPGAQWMYSASQMFPFPGKRTLKEEMATRDSESLKALYESARLKTIARVKELYYDLFFTHKNMDLIKERIALFSRIEDAALSRYSAGMAPQQEVLMAQTEKYMLLEKEEMLKQKLQSLEATLNTTAGRDVKSPLGRPSAPVYILFKDDMERLLKLAYENSPEIKAREKMIRAAEAKVRMAEKEYYPDFTVTGTVFDRRKDFKDMWSLTTTINIPLFYKTKQKMAVLEAESALSEAKHELEAVKFMLSSGIRENYSRLRTSEKLMDLYKTGLIPKAYQDFEAAIAGYVSGKIEAITVISRLKALIDYETLYWGQFAEREKAIARLEAITATNGYASSAGKILKVSAQREKEK